MNHGRHRWPQFISPFAIGSGADAALGVLFAPHSGEDTSKYLRDAVQDGADKAVSHGNTVMRRVSKTVDDASFRSTKSRTWPKAPSARRAT
jgi:gas vesicle protein